MGVDRADCGCVLLRLLEVLRVVLCSDGTAEILVVLLVWVVDVPKDEVNEPSGTLGLLVGATSVTDVVAETWSVLSAEPLVMLANVTLKPTEAVVAMSDR